METACESSNTDFASSGKLRFILWILPAIVFVIGFSTGPAVRTILWVASLSTMGISCVSNARRCGRIHCYFTGPFLLLGALFTLLYGLNIFNFHVDWGTLAIVIVVGFNLLKYIPEMIWGKYKLKEQV